MNQEISHRMIRSSEAFRRMVWPIVCPLLGGGDLVPVEGFTDVVLAARLDTLAGVDAWQIVDKRGMRGIASRVQFGDRSWDTFTIRYQCANGSETEYQKRLRAVLNPGAGWLFPQFTIHAYLDEAAERCFGVAVVWTADLFKHVRDCFDPKALHDRSRCYARKTAADGNTFIAVPWKHLSESLAGWRGKECRLAIRQWHENEDRAVKSSRGANT